jgi:hypothetical protein
LQPEEDPTMNSQPAVAVTGSHDGDGAADHDVPFRFGRRPRAMAPYPFSTRQYARLLVLRSQAEAGLIGADDRRAE